MTYNPSEDFSALYMSGNNETIPRFAATTALTIPTSGNCYATRFTPVTGGTKAWTANVAAGTTGSGVTMYAGVWDTSGTLLYQSASITLQSIGGSTAAFSSFTWTAGTAYYVGFGVRWTTTAPSLAGVTLPGNIIFNSPIMAIPQNTTTWTSTLPALNTLGTTTFVPWVALT